MAANQLPVPHGGYVTSIFLSVAKLHFDTVRAAYQQRHTIAVQLTFLRRTSLGPGTFTVTELKLGRRTSTIQISLSQEEQPFPLVVGYFTQSNIDAETGISIALPPTLSPVPPISNSTKALRDGTDPDWKLHETKFSKFRKAGQHILTYLPRNGQPGVIDQWLKLASGENFTQESLGYVVDSFPQILETTQNSSDLAKELNGIGRQDSQLTTHDGSRNPGNVREGTEWAKSWYPTVVLNMEIKKTLQAEGTEWLFSRVKATQIRNGRMDIEIVILDQAWDIVALSNHVALVVPAERNVVRNKGRGEKNSESKL